MQRDESNETLEIDFHQFGLNLDNKNELKLDVLGQYFGENSEKEILILTTTDKITKKPNSYRTQTGTVFQLKQNLIRHARKSELYFVYSKKKCDFFGKGTYSLARRIIGIFQLRKNDGPVFHVVHPDEMVAKIINHKDAQLVNIERGQIYNHNETVENHNALISRLLYLKEIYAYGPPIQRMCDNGIFKTIIIERNLGSPLNEYLKVIYKKCKFKLPFKNLISIFTRIMCMYKEQIHNSGYVHRDIKPENIMLKIVNKQLKINFIDLKQARPIDELATSYGSLGYLAPEAKVTEKIVVTTALDIYSLGVVLCGLINPKFDPDLYYAEYAEILCKDEQLVMFEDLANHINDHQCYNPDAMNLELTLLNSNLEIQDDGLINASVAYSSNFFEYIQDDSYNEVHIQDIKDLIRTMTDLNPAERPPIQQIIEQLSAISLELNSQPQNNQSMQNI